MKNPEIAIYAFVAAVHASERLEDKKRKEEVVDQAEKAMTFSLRPTFGNTSMHFPKNSICISPS